MRLFNRAIAGKNAYTQFNLGKIFCKKRVDKRGFGCNNGGQDSWELLESRV